MLLFLAIIIGIFIDSLINAAKTDGAETFTLYRRIVLPLSPLPFVMTAVYQFINIWNDFLFGLVIASGIENQPASVVLANLKGGFIVL